MFDHERERMFKLRNHQLTREENSKLVFNLINAHGSVARVELVRLTGLSPSTVSSLVDDLVRMGLVTETGHARMLSGAGRRPIMLNICPSGRQIPVFSLSRAGVRYTLFDLGYNVLEQVFLPFAAEGEASSAAEAARARAARYLSSIEEILSRRSEKLDKGVVDAVLVSYPGFYVREERAYVLTALQTVFPRDEVLALEKRLGLSIFMGNSSMNLAYAEKKHRDASGERVENLVYFNICEGVGAGIICDGEMFMRPGRIAGEIGHSVVEIGGRPCACGNRGCLECYASAEAIVSAVQDALRESDAAGLPEYPTMEEIGRAYDAGVAPVCAALDGIAEKLFVGINNAVSITGIRCVVIGGIVGIGEGFLRKLRSCLAEQGCRMLMRGVRIEYSAIGERADSIGLAQYFIDKLLVIKGRTGK